MALLLKDKRVSPDADNNKAIKHACMNGHFKAVELLLLDKRVTPDNECFLNAAHGCHAEVVYELLKDTRIDPAFDNNYALRIACCKGYIIIVDMLLDDERVNPLEERDPPLDVALRNEHFDIVCRLLIDKRVINSISHEKASLLLQLAPTKDDFFGLFSVY